MKGQIFITVSIIVAVALLMLSVNSVKVESSNNYLHDYFVNLKTETINVVDDTILNKEDISANLDKFILFSNGIMTEKGYTQIIKYNVNGNQVTVDIQLSKGEEYYKDIIIIDRTVTT